MSIDEMKAVIQTLARAGLNALMFGRACPVFDQGIIADGRKRKKAWERLVVDGYVAHDGKLLSRAFDEVEEVAPSLIGRLAEKRDRHYWERSPGVSWASLPLNEQKWVVQHREEYEFFIFDNTWTSGGERSWAQGTSLPEKYPRELWLRDAAFKAIRDREMYDLKFLFLKQQNMAWAMTEQGYASEDEKGLFNVTEAHMPFTEPGFGTDPSTWETDLDAMLKRRAEKIERLMQQRLALERIKVAIAADGGWSKFHERYDAALREAMEKDPSP